MYCCILYFTIEFVDELEVKKEKKNQEKKQNGEISFPTTVGRLMEER